MSRKEPENQYVFKCWQSCAMYKECRRDGGLDMAKDCIKLNSGRVRVPKYKIPKK